ncbi:hypothetical protein BS50DRAFT_576476 [Corynespora cassiicola Philippines]|uniref:JmjC domain-containing protein n=1 Tax=Corynespora cassiicola Philippines TaxID=1448308 RepID=A0A2T2NFN3_CORCC|nr:hypothetical protein BS50DRAFT_576476 [Corynespora cassiicola Philippines]
MPAARPRASFEPIPPDFDVRTFVETADNFQYADRISYEMITNTSVEEFEKIVLLHVIIAGKPLVIDGFEEVLDPWTFTPSWLRDNHGEKIESARNLTTKDNLPLTIKHYLKHMGKLTEQYFDGPDQYRDKTRQRIYLKDIDCPQVWQDKLKEHIPPGLFYLNESTGEIGGPGALDEPSYRKGRGIGRAGDLMSSLPPGMRAENLMCYIGHEGTYTPSHREMCASIGQNIMVNASGQIAEDGQPERPGSSLWFMTETKDRHLVSEYWLSVLGHDIEVENHFAQLIAWKKAPFRTYVVEQRPGDFILIPPLAPHQVWNRGTRTMKIAWNRTTVETLEMAIAEALPNSRIVCRDEQYKNKAIIYYTLLKYSQLLKSARAQVEMGGEQAVAIQQSIKVRQVQRDFKRLFDLYKVILLSEMFSPDSRERPEFIPYDSNVTCAYCRCNIFNRFLTCKSCKNLFSEEIEEPYDVCMDCYCMGRSCGCQSGYTWVEQWKWKDLIHKYEEWRAQTIDIDGHITEKTPLPLQEERRYLGKKTLAQVCQEQLKIRPFVDIKNPKPDNEPEEEEIIVNDDGTVKKTSKKKSKQWLMNHKSCHFCIHRHPNWKMASCTNCDLGYCYGTLFRAHDMMPLEVMENPSWKCPHCRRTCNTGVCRRDPRQHPYEPKGTLLGHDTKKVADPRSVECLVDFSVSNLNWLREDDVPGQSNGPMQRRRHEADIAKLADPSLDDRFLDESQEYPRNGIAYSPMEVTPSRANGFDSESAFGGPSTAQNGYHYERGMSQYPDPDPYGEIPRLGQKRSRDDDGDEEGNNKRRSKSKKQKKKVDNAKQPLQPKNASGQQYQKEMQKRLLDEAKREDRFILVAARMKGKSKVIKLALSPYLLSEIQNRPIPERPQVIRQDPVEDTGDLGSILQSDVVPKKSAASQAKDKEKGPKTFRYRVEEDESYSTRKRNPEPSEGFASAKPGRPSKKSRRYEEVTIDSDSDVDYDNEFENSTPKPSRPRARTSNWLARKNQGEEDLPTELPPDFRDGLVSNPNREKNRTKDSDRRKSSSATSKTLIRPLGQPSGRQARDSTGNVSDETGIGEEENDSNQALLAQSAAAALEASRGEEEERARAEAAAREAEERARAEAAAREAEENLRAKMGIAQLFEDEEDESLNGFIDELAAEDEPLHHENKLSDDELPPKASPIRTRTGPPQSKNSIFNKPGMAGKKIKVVGTSSKQNGESTPAKASSSVSGFTSINNRSAKTVNLSDDSDSDGEEMIPAKAPVPPPKPSGRPVGRPKGSGRTGLVPSRGSSSGMRGRGRGRGRPRKST